jgi:hypothetical protein
MRSHFGPQPRRKISAKRLARPAPKVIHCENGSARGLLCTAEYQTPNRDGGIATGPEVS